MKKIIESLFALGMLFATVGCDQDQIVAKFDTSGEDAGTAYFVKNAVSENFEASATGTQTINLDLFRQDAAGELTVGLTAEMGGGREVLPDSRECDLRRRRLSGDRSGFGPRRGEV